MRYYWWTIAGLVIACATNKADSSENATGLDSGALDDLDVPADDPHDGSTDDGDTGTPTDDDGWLSAPENCSAPETLPADPLVMTERTEISGFAHVVDVVHNPDTERTYVAGIPTLTEWQHTEAGIIETGRYERGAVDHVALIGTDTLAVSKRGDAEKVGRIVLFQADGLRTLGSLDLPDAAGMVAQADRLYALSGQGTLSTIDISTPNNPTIVDTLEGLGTPWDLVIEGDYAYIADNSKGLVVADLTDPDSPILLDTVTSVGGLQDVTVVDGFAYGAAGSRGVEVFSLADPAAPVSVAIIEPGGAVISVAVADGVLWIANQLGVAAIDVSEPAAPVLIGSESTTSWAMGVTAMTDSVFLAGWSEVAIFTADPSITAPDAQPDLSALYFPEGTTEQLLNLNNNGGAPLEIVGLLADLPDIEVRVDRLTVPPGEAAQIRVRWLGSGDLAGNLCIATNDPDGPALNLEILTSNDDSSVLIGELAPDFSLPSVDGQYYTLSEHLGQPIVLVYFATW
jgi:hypothetical protein